MVISVTQKGAIWLPNLDWEWELACLSLLLQALRALNINLVQLASHLTVIAAEILMRSQQQVGSRFCHIFLSNSYATGLCLEATVTWSSEPPWTHDSSIPDHEKRAVDLSEKSPSPAIYLNNQ